MDNTQECKVSKCTSQCGSHFFFLLMAAFAVIFLFEIIFHSLLLMPDYNEANPRVWLSLTTILKTMIPWAITKQASLAIIATYVFIKYYEGKGMHEGIRFGIHFGLLLGLAEFGNCLYLPIPTQVSLEWFASGVLEGLCVGVAITVVSHILPKKPQT